MVPVARMNRGWKPTVVVIFTLFSFPQAPECS